MTLMFWFLAWGMTLLVLGLLLWPLLKRQSLSEREDVEKRLSVYRQQFAELEGDFKNSVVTEDQYQQSKRELERRLLEESSPDDVASPLRQWSINRTAIAVALAVLIPTASGLLYWKMGNPLAITHPTVSNPASPDGADPGHQSAEGLDALSERLKKKLEQNPNDGVGWALLARSYVEIGRHSEAIPLYEKAMQLIPNDAQMLADYADALGVLNGRKLEGRPEELIQQALKADPRNVKALMLAGTVAYNHKEFGRAASYWEDARANLPPGTDPEAIQEIMNGIAEAKELGGIRQAGTATTSAAPMKPTSPGSSLAISGKVNLSPSLAAKASPTDTLFVFARAVDGPPMPVAIVRATKRDLPFTFRLDDTNSPMPARKLSESGQVVIVARISKSGEAMPKSGDLQGTSQPVKPGVSGITVTIDQEIP